MRKNEDTFYFYSPANDQDENGKASEVPKNLRQRRQTVAAVVVGKTLVFGKSECSHKDIFLKSTGRNIARGRALSKDHSILKMDISPTTEIAKVFVLAAKELLTPPPPLKVTSKVVIKRAK